MIIYSIIFVYVFIVGWICRQHIISNNITTKYNNYATVFISIILLALPVFFIGMRTNYIDTKGYIAQFVNMDTSWNNIIDINSRGLGWHIYVWTIRKFITDNPQVYLLITATIQMGAVCKLFFKISSDFPFSILLFFLSCSFVNLMNGIREFMSLCLILYFLELLFSKKTFKFIIIILIASTIHLASLVWIFAYFFIHGKPGNIKTIIFTFLILLFIVFADRFVGFLDFALQNTIYSGYSSHFLSDSGSNIAHSLIALVPVVIFLVFKKDIEQKNNATINILINIAILGAMVSILANFTSGLLVGRLPIYFTVFNYALLPWLFKNVAYEKYNSLFRLICILGYLAYAIYYMTHAWGTKSMPYISDTLGINTWK